MTLHTRIVLLALILSLAVMAGTGIPAWLYLSTAMRQAAVRSLQVEAEAAALAIIASPVPGTVAQSRASRLERLVGGTDRSIILFSTDGEILAKAGAHDAALQPGKSMNPEFFFASHRLPDTLASPLGGAMLCVAMPRAEQERASGELRNILLASGVLLLGVVLAVSVPLARRVTGRVKEMAHTARLIAGGSLSERARMASADELGELAGAVNEMAEKLNNEIEMLRKLERVRSEFLGNVSHELRTPIFSIQGFLETLLDGAIDDPGVNRDFLEKAHRQADRLNALLRDLIEISRIESGEMKMSFRFFPIRPFLQQSMDEMRPEAERKSIALGLAGPADVDVEVYADRERLRQVMVNLIDNALKYTDQGGAVTVSVLPVGTRCEISVTDNGCGIPPEHLSRIFERFYRVDRDRSRAVGGTGLGLAIVKHIVEAHGGSISVESRVGQGSTFTFSLKR